MVGIRPIFVAIVMLALLPASAAANTTTQIFVKREADLSAAERRDIRADADVRFVETVPLPRTEVVEAVPGDVRDAVRDLNADPDVVYAERARPLKAFADPCGPFGTNPCLWGVARIFANDPNAAWGLSTGAGRTVAVVDSGIDAAHPDLVGKVVQGKDWVEDDTESNDEDGHGTHVAGTIAAVRDNEEGIVGAAPDARVAPLRVLDAAGSGDAADVVDAFIWAGQRRLGVVNASLGAEGFLETEYNAIAAHQHTLYVVAAGNENQDNDNPATASYPCAYSIDHGPSFPGLDNILCVGATDRNDVKASFSNYGTNSVAIYAPGVQIPSTRMGDYWYSSGTSMATPHVAAAAAMLAARSPTLDPVQIRDALLDNATTVGAIKRLNARAALAAVDADPDGDGVVAPADNCPNTWNPLQEDTDADGTGDACDSPTDLAPDRDQDGFDDDADPCPDEKWAASTDGCGLPAPTSLDRDHDGVSDTSDPCPDTTEPGGFGCPDADGDRVPNDGRDNCPTVANPAQTDTDADGVGDACDSTPRGHDNDGDGKPSLDDACPNQYGTLWNGCPAPTPPPPAPADSDGDGRIDASDACPVEYAVSNDGCPLPQISSLSAKARKRTATVRVRSTRVATLRITVERRKGGRWVRVARRTVVGTSKTLRLSRLKRGAYRARVSVSSAAGAGSPASDRFRVR